MLGLHMGKTIDEAKHYELHDTCDWLGLINQASVVSNYEAGLLEKTVAKEILKAQNEVERLWRQPGAVRPELYITYEPEILKRAGMQASSLHVGRSSQDILATANAALNIEGLARIGHRALAVAEAFVDLAARTVDAVVPAFTNGVQAQPTLMSHKALAHKRVFFRDVQRIFECLRRYDVCPMGSCVLNGSNWPVPVARMSELLGFSRPLENAYDVGQCCGNDFPLEISQIVTSLMLHVNTFLADFSVQYADTHPWLLLGGGEGVYVSSAMPQKRNPGVVNDCRRDAGLVMGAAQGVLMRMQNLPMGMADVRDRRVMDELMRDAVVTLASFEGIVRRLHVDQDRALALLNDDWTATQNLADALVRCNAADFRRAHGFASILTACARKERLTPVTMTYKRVQQLWADWAGGEEGVLTEFPLSQMEWQATLDPRCVLEGRKTTGGANPNAMASAVYRAQVEMNEAREDLEDYLARISEVRKTLRKEIVRYGLQE